MKLLLQGLLVAVALLSSSTGGARADVIQVPGHEIAAREPAQVFLPKDYESRDQWPVIILLHGFKANRSLQSFYMGFRSRRNSHGFIAVLPQGIKNTKGQRFWNATDWCCDFEQSNVDDFGYLKALIQEIVKKYKADPKRISILGHSNGGFMANRMACDASELLAGIVSFAGGGFYDSTRCQPQSPVSVLQIHAVDDPLVPYDRKDPTFESSGQPAVPGVPGAENTVKQWATHNGCAETPLKGSAINFILGLGREDTSVVTYRGCNAETSVALWTTKEGGVSPHIPPLKGGAMDRVIDFLLSQKKSAR